RALGASRRETNSSCSHCFRPSRWPPGSAARCNLGDYLLTFGAPDELQESPDAWFDFVWVGVVDDVQRPPDLVGPLEQVVQRSWHAINIQQPDLSVGQGAAIEGN